MRHRVKSASCFRKTRPQRRVPNETIQGVRRNTLKAHAGQAIEPSISSRSVYSLRYASAMSTFLFFCPTLSVAFPLVRSPPTFCSSELLLACFYNAKLGSCLTNMLACHTHTLLAPCMLLPGNSSQRKERRPGRAIRGTQQFLHVLRVHERVPKPVREG